MVTRADGTKISEFLATDTLADSDLVTLVRSSTNYKMTVGNLKTALGIGVSAPRGLLYMQGNSTDTVIATQGVPVLIAGTWSSEAATGFTATAAGRLTYTGTTTRVFKVDAHISATGASDSPTTSLLIAKNGTVIAGSEMATQLQNTHEESISTSWELSLVTGDYIELFIENNSNTVDILVDRAILRVS